MDPDPGLAFQHEALESLLQSPSAELARRLGVDPARLETVLARAAQLSAATADSPLRLVGQALQSHVRLAFLEACVHLPAETALQLFEEEDLLELVGRWGLVHAVLADPAFLTIHELADILDECAVHLEWNRSSLVTMGVPRTTLGASWPGMLLQYLYPTGFIYQERQDVVEDAQCVSPRDYALKHLPAAARATRAHTYLFDRVVGSTLTSASGPSTIDQSLMRWGPYEEASRYPELPAATAARIEAGRSRFLDLQIAVLRVLAKELRRAENAENLWSQSLTLLTEALPADDAAFYLEVDQWAYGYDIASGESQGDGALHPFPGGLSQLLVIIGHCEKERTIGTMHHTKRMMPPAVLVDASFRSYFQAIGQPWHQKLDRALDQFVTRESQEDAFWIKFRDRVNAAIEHEFYAEVVIRTRVKQQLTAAFEPYIRSFVDFQREHLHATGTVAQISSGSVATTPAPQAPSRTIRSNGKVRSFAFEDTEGHVRESKGMRYLSYLLLHPKEEVHVLDIIHFVDDSGSANSTPTQQDISELGAALELDFRQGIPVLEKHDKAEYEKQARRLEAELSELPETGYEDEKVRIRADLEAIAEQMAHATGRGGRDRMTHSDTEKARSNISTQITDAIEEIRIAHPALADHLACVKKGTYCQYNVSADQEPWVLLK